MLRVEKIRKNLKNHRILYDINFSLKRGEILIILGNSGCGKSTLLKCLNGLLKVDNGNIFFNGINITDKNTDLKEIRKKIGIVFQSYNLFPHMTVLQNLLLAPLKVKIEAKNQAEKDAMILLEKVGLLDKIASYPAQLSGGQAQRVAIARSLMMKPELMLFDEPTSALDPKMTQEVCNVLKELKKDGMTMILVTHDINFAKEMADRIILMKNGTIVETNNCYDFFNTPQTIYAKEYLKHLGNNEDTNA